MSQKSRKCSGVPRTFGCYTDSSRVFSALNMESLLTCIAHSNTYIYSELIQHHIFYNAHVWNNEVFTSRQLISSDYALKQVYQLLGFIASRFLIRGVTYIHLLNIGLSYNGNPMSY